MKLKSLAVVSLAAIMLLGLSGCGSLSYYSQIVNGHYALMESREDIKEIIDDRKYTASVRARLALALEIRQFAVDELDLPDNDSYKTFVKLDRPYPIWNVIAAGKFSVKAKQWCFLVVGCISYRGYFKLQEAEAKAKQLTDEGYDVAVSPAVAYSTLGWFNDPLLSSMLYKQDAYLAGIIFHELAHQKVYVDDDSSFNEAFATAVELEGVRRWLAKHGEPGANRKYRQYKHRQGEFYTLLRATHQQLKTLYQTEKDVAVLTAGKARIIANMKSEYQRLKKAWHGDAGYDKWMARDINNADLALVATYHELVPAFEALLKAQDNDLVRFYAEVKRVGNLPEQQRAEVLARLTQTTVATE